MPSGSPTGVSCYAIDLGDFTGYSDKTTIGVNSGTDSWTAATSGTQRNRDNWHTYAVEVTPPGSRGSSMRRWSRR